MVSGYLRPKAPLLAYIRPALANRWPLATIMMMMMMMTSDDDDDDDDQDDN